MGEFGWWAGALDCGFADFGLCRTYLIFSSFCFSMCVFVWFFIPETKGESSPLIVHGVFC